MLVCWTVLLFWIAVMMESLWYQVGICYNKVWIIYSTNQMHFPNRYLLDFCTSLISLYVSFLQATLPFTVIKMGFFWWGRGLLRLFTWCLWSWTATPIVSANAYSPSFHFRLVFFVQKNTDAAAVNVKHISYHKPSEQTHRPALGMKMVWLCRYSH